MNCMDIVKKKIITLQRVNKFPNINKNSRKVRLLFVTLADGYIMECYHCNDCPY